MTLNEFFAAHPKCALGFSGGVDSAYLLYAGVQAGADIRPYYIKTAFQPRFERDDALRPGMRAQRELEVRSPLRECGLTKADIRRLSREAGLFTWDKPAYACLATRIPTGEAITGEILARVEGAEDALFRLGYTDFRVRVFHGAARLQLPAGQLERAVRERAVLRAALAPYFKPILLDLEER